MLPPNRVGDVKPEDLPELPEREKIELLADKAFKVLDPTKVGKRNIVWGLIRAWRAYLLGSVRCLSLEN